MRRVLALAAALTLAACGTSQRATPPAGEAPVDVSSIAETETPTGALDGPVDPAPIEPAAAPIPETTTTTAEPAVQSPTPAADEAPPTTTTTSTTPEVELDLSDLDGVLQDLDVLLGGLGAAMNQTEGEVTP